MSTFYNYDPYTGIRETERWDDDGKVTIHQEEDVSELLDQCKNSRNQGLADSGIKASFWHYAEIPMTVVLELKKKGIDIFKREHKRAMMREINQNYPYLKLTDKMHA